MPAIDPNAIIQFEEAAYSPTGSATITSVEVLGSVTNTGILRPEFLSDGVRARILSPGGQWQEGILRLSLDFVPQAMQPPVPR